MALLFNSSFEYKILRMIKDPNGCFLIIDIDIELLQKRLTLINLYGPSAGDHPEFYEEILQYTLQIGNDVNVLSGDWNCVLNPLLDSKNYTTTTRPHTHAKIFNSMQELNLSDVFWEFYPEKKSYTWKKFNSTCTKQSRLHYFLITSK